MLKPNNLENDLILWLLKSQKEEHAKTCNSVLTVKTPATVHALYAHFSKDIHVTNAFYINSVAKSVIDYIMLQIILWPSLLNFYGIL